MLKKKLYINCKKIFFDFDGVIVDSNYFKEKAITESIKQVCPENLNVKNSISFFNQNAGQGREKKLSKFFDKNIVDKILNVYTEKCYEFFSYQKTTYGCRDFIKLLRNSYPELKIHILSGGNYNEIKKFLVNNKMDTFFNKILFDNKSKKQHLIDENALSEDIFFGDSKGDLITAKNHPLSFILVKGYSSKLSRPSFDQEKYTKFSICNFSNIELNYEKK